jgi:hypothetical protein
MRKNAPYITELRCFELECSDDASLLCIYVTRQSIALTDREVCEPTDQAHLAVGSSSLAEDQRFDLVDGRSRTRIAESGPRFTRFSCWIDSVQGRDLMVGSG